MSRTVPYTTHAGLKIGVYWRPVYRAPEVSADAERLQTALLQSRKTRPACKLDACQQGAQPCTAPDQCQRTKDAADTALGVVLWLVGAACAVLAAIGIAKAWLAP